MISQDWGFICPVCPLYNKAERRKGTVPSITQPVVAQQDKSPKPIAQSVISQLNGYNFTLLVKHLDWTHNIILMKQVKDIRPRYWYMVQSITNHWTTRYLQKAIKLDDYGKLNFYCSAVDDILCREGDNRTIGLLLCKTKDCIKAEYALRDIQKPIGISDYELGQALSEDFRGSLPTIEEIENELEAKQS